MIITNLVSDDGKVNVWVTQESSSEFAVYSEHTAFHAAAGAPTRYKNPAAANQAAQKTFERMMAW